MFYAAHQTQVQTDFVPKWAATNVMNQILNLTVKADGRHLFVIFANHPVSTEVIPTWDTVTLPSKV